MHPADTTPAKMLDSAAAVGIPSRNAPMAPVHAPVPGRGMPTKAARLAHRFRGVPTPSDADLDSARLRMGSMRARTDLLRRRRRRGTMGAMLPRTQMGRTYWMGTPIQTPTGTAPRSSTTGRAEMRARTAKSDRPKDWKYRATFWPVCRCSKAAAAAPWDARAGEGDDDRRATKKRAKQVRFTRNRNREAKVAEAEGAGVDETGAEEEAERASAEEEPDKNGGEPEDRRTGGTREARERTARGAGPTKAVADSDVSASARAIAGRIRASFTIVS
mmetsp:Transcript_21942/g.50008  ORF Transcript_21942/g.50008 Transcript_21942/m.50008 type:complete len:274 (-) Transcript_21942:20-841(-)